MKPRDKNEIFASILNTASTGDVRLTKIMYSSFLSYTQVVEYLQSLVEMQFLDYNVVAKSYRITVKGLKFLQLHEKMCKMLSA
ncbi:MAG: winged helix-turn-helix domain-containing protein [Candidatus Eiseniibacteriota bacterium]|jgi:predicted transcriptional regulator